MRFCVARFRNRWALGYTDLVSSPTTAKELRKLIFRYHPDRAMDDATRARFEEITKTLTARYEVALKGSPNANDQTSLGEMAYDLYRLGYSLYERIHPSSWRKNTIINPLTGDLTYGSDAEQIRILDQTLRVFRLATEAFGAVVQNHPTSEWAADSREKTELLRSLYARYERMAANLKSTDSK